ncbi:anaerobic ribonucleoside-triphosphate reductase activating protein [Candidatus Omnitrophota bacterium]
MKSSARKFNIRGFQETTLIDWDGKIASIIFMGGCNFRCGYCHSGSLVLEDDKNELISIDYVENFLNSKKGWIDGVVIMGGEPTLNEESLRELVARIKKIGFLVKLDTNGSNPKILKKLINDKLIDYVALDIKAPLRKEAYERVVGVTVDIIKIIESKDILLGSRIDYEFRTTVVPGIICPGDIAEIAKSISHAKKYCIQQFLPKDTLDPFFLKTQPYSLKELNKLALIAYQHLPNVVIRKN